MLLSGRVDLVQEIDGAEHVVALRARRGGGEPAQRLAHGAGARARLGAVHHARRGNGDPAGVAA